MTKEELIEFIQKLPDDAVLRFESANFDVLDPNFKKMGVHEHLMILKEPTIQHNLKFTMVFKSADKYFPNTYTDKTKGFYKDLFTKE